MSDQGYGTPELEDISVHNKNLVFKVHCIGSTTLSATQVYCLNGSGVQCWTQVNSATAPGEANFASLVSNASPTVLGFYIPVGNAVRLHSVSVDPASIRSASMTAGTLTGNGGYKGSVSSISGNEGVTAPTGAAGTTGNIAFQLSCVNLKLTDSSNIHEFSVNVDYDAI